MAIATQRAGRTNSSEVNFIGFGACGVAKRNFPTTQSEGADFYKCRSGDTAIWTHRY